MDLKRLEKNIRPSDDTLVRVTSMGNVTEIMTAPGASLPPVIRRLSADLYEDLRTGEVKEFQHAENRGQDLKGVARSLARLRAYLNTNITDVAKCRWVTLTYAENMTDPKRLQADFEAFNRRHRKNVGQYEYITAAEPQGRGAWHLHVVMIFPKKAPFIPNEVMRDDWRQGFVTVKKLDDVDNVGAYLTAYLGDMELQEAVDSGIRLTEITQYDMKTIEYEENGVKKSKAFLKGARLCMYPPKFKLYRCSSGIRKPDIQYMTAEQAEKKVSADTLTFEKTLILSDEEQGFSRLLNYRYYNAKR